MRRFGSRLRGLYTGVHHTATSICRPTILSPAPGARSSRWCIDFASLASQFLDIFTRYSVTLDVWMEKW